MALMGASLLLGNVANIQSVLSKKSGGKAQSVRSGQGLGKAQSIRNVNILTRKLPEAVRTARHKKDVARNNRALIRKEK